MQNTDKQLLIQCINQKLSELNSKVNSILNSYIFEDYKEMALRLTDSVMSLSKFLTSSLLDDRLTGLNKRLERYSSYINMVETGQENEEELFNTVIQIRAELENYIFYEE